MHLAVSFLQAVQSSLDINWFGQMLSNLLQAIDRLGFSVFKSHNFLKTLHISASLSESPQITQRSGPREHL